MLHFVCSPVLHVLSMPIQAGIYTVHRCVVAVASFPGSLSSFFSHVVKKLDREPGNEAIVAARELPGLESIII